MELRKIIDRSLLIWCGLFVLGLLVGSLGYRTILPRALPLVQTGMDVSVEISGNSIMTALFLFLKNALVALFCALLGRGTKGMFPAVVCFLNGSVLGFLGSVLSAYGQVPVWKYAAVLSPHGVIEMAAIFLACSIGVRSETLAEKLRLLSWPLAMLAAAACIETWVSVGMANRIL